MNNPFEYRPDEVCRVAFERLVERVRTLRGSIEEDDRRILSDSEVEADRRFLSELEAGKMLGVLVARDAEGMHHTLYAFSGQLGQGGFHYPGFVGPVFDYLDPDGYFKTNEREISLQNKEIAQFEKGELHRKEEEFRQAEERVKAEIDDYRQKCRKSKKERDARRKAGVGDAEELAAMIRQSQYEKAELHRLKKRMAVTLLPYEENLRQTQAQLASMKEKRRKDSENLQQWLFDNFKVLNAKGESKSLTEIFADTPMGIPPSGAGECCGPKLLQAAYLRGWQPISIAEYWYGKPKEGEVRHHGRHYPACRGKCRPVLGWMLQGLDVEPPLETECRSSESPYEPEILFENEWFCVVNKPSGMLSVPGKGREKSLQQWLAERYGEAREVKMAHRLDQDTSGLIVATFGLEAFKTMQSLFATRQVHKTYLADLEGDYTSQGLPQKGQINLPLSPDYLDRPRQKVDFEDGKEATTEYEFIGVAEGRSRIAFHPLTGRTHQLRVHSASTEGLGMPIVGDRIYGNAAVCADRLHLHAHKIEFTFPLDGQHYSFTSHAEFLMPRYVV